MSKSSRLVAPAPAENEDFSEADVDSYEASMIVGNEEEEEKVDQIERVLGQFMFKEQGMNVEQAFKYHNKDADDGLSEAELKSILKKAKCPFSPREFEILMSRYDLDNSGSITAQEFQITYRVNREGLQDFTPLKYETENGMSSELLAASSSRTSGSVKFSTISNIDDYWTWLEEVLIPQYFTQTDALGEALAKEEWGFVSRFNKILGRGVEIAQARSVQDTCQIEELAYAYARECNPKDKLDDQDFGVPLCDEEQGITEDCWPPASTTVKPASGAGGGGGGNSGGGGGRKLSTENFDKFDTDGFKAQKIDCESCTNREIHNAAYFFTLDYLNPQDILQEQLQYYKSRDWIGQQTVELMITVATYNAEHGIFAQMILYTEFERGGGVTNKWTSESILGDPYGIESDKSITYQWVIGLDILWIIMVSALMIGEFREMKQLGAKYLKDFWNVLDWVQCILTLGIECYWVYIALEGYGLIQLYANSYDPEMLLDNFNGTLVTDDRVNVARKLNLLLQSGMFYRYLTIINILVLVIRFFKAFNVQPRLAVISQTISKAVPDIAHFMVIFLCLWFTFVMFAHFVFGHMVKSYSNVGNAMFNTLRGFVAAPAVNVPEIIQTNGYTVIPRYWVVPVAELWWLMYMILLFLVVRSILLAIVLESYKEAKLSSTHATTMWGQFGDMMKDVVSSFRGVIRLRDILSVLENKLADRERVNMEMILRCYAQDLKSQPKKQNMNFEESKAFAIGLIKEFFAWKEVRLPAQDKLRALSAFARISELDGNFNDVCGRIDTLEQKFHSIHSLLEDLKARES